MKTIATLILLAAASAIALADGNSSTGTVSGSVTIVAPISVTKVSDMNFGTLVVDLDEFSPGMLCLDSSGNLNSSKLGGGTWLFTGSGHPTPSAAQFTVTGMDGYPFGFIANPFLVMLKDGTSMKIIPNVVLVDGLTHGTVPSTVNVGGQLGLLNGKPGLWSGTFTAVVSYL
jgi:hypothetical protein